MRSRHLLIGVGLAVTVSGGALPAAAQEGSGSAQPELRPGSIAVLDVALYTAGANVQEASDSARSTLATAVLRGKLAELVGRALVDSVEVAREAAAPASLALTGGKPCNVIVACAKALGRKLGTDWVVMAKVSKTSNLIWLLTGQLINPRTGELVLDDTTELKGDPEAMIRAGTRIFAERVARAIRAGEAARLSSRLGSSDRP